ncbi:integrase [Candidatus Mycobacterium methanotrophicum]|uniref:Integrase n=1 Tax=Candidatus Mycobacterium methanotrophicum TaxID=2943498 RepID=A0ABY4QKK5_9MYCO|nr:integrase [Candidatus Mycobacterium methanotrophicum]UQX10777.1 integrase [Candidatus Mycobacterium methanotrophicum]
MTGPPAAAADGVGHKDASLTMRLYAHLIKTDDHTGNMAALGALAALAQTPRYGNVIPLHG